MYYVTDENSLNEYNLYLQEENLKVLNKTKTDLGTIVELSNGTKFTFTIPEAKEQDLSERQIKELIYGKDDTTRIVSVETKKDQLILFRELEDGSVVKEVRPTKLFLLANKPYPGFTKLKGENYFKYIKFYSDELEFVKARRAVWDYDLYAPMNTVSSNLLYTGITFFKDLKVKEVSILSFDIESSGVAQDKNSKVYMISNTYRQKDKVIKKLFVETPKFKKELTGDYTDYVFCDNQKDLIDKWCEWVREINPSIVVGHNIYTYDFPYLMHCAKLAGTKILLGRDGSEIKLDIKESRFRKDGTQFYNYTRCFIFGRNIIDTFFLSFKHDIKREYDNNRLKYIIKHEGLEKEGRQHYDAGLINKNIGIKEEWEKITRYAIDDSDDSLKLFDLMIPPYFYLCPHIPMIFEDLINRASGSQINAFMVRGYIQQGESIPKPEESSQYEGAISIGNPGIYKHVWKVDVASLYPSIMRQWKVCNATKDPNMYFIKMVDYFTLERLANKKRAKDTGDIYYTNMEQAQKIVINSAYGFLGAAGLNFNSPDLAAFVTQKGREILSKSIDWAKSKGYELVNADTDSISITNGKDISEEERKALLDDLNAQYPDLIRFEDDGYYKSFVVVKVKNYLMYDPTAKPGKQLKIKGSALKSPSKEVALQEMNDRVLKALAGITHEAIEDIYMEYVKEACNIKDINRWASKKTVSEKLLKGTRTNETKVLKAMEGSDFSEGDKIYIYFKKDGSLGLKENFDGDYDVSVLHKKIFKSISTFETVLDMSKFMNYSLKRNQKLLEGL